MVVRRVIKRFFLFLILSFLFISVCFADDILIDSPDIDSSVSDMFDGVFELVGQVVPSLSDDSSLPLDVSPDDSFDSELYPGSSVNNNLLVVATPSYELSDIATSFYDALVQAEASHIDDFSEVTDVQIMPIFTPDTGTTTIPQGTLRYVLNQIIGPYSPVVVQYQYQSTSSNYAYVREIFPDYQWMISAGIFALVLYCVFRLWGAWLCKR